MIRILQGDCRDILATLPEQSIQCCVTSPPYYGLRDYGVDGQIGLEKTPDQYVAEMVAVFREVRRVLRDDGVLWLNLGSSFASKMIESDEYVIRRDIPQQFRAEVAQAMSSVWSGYESAELAMQQLLGKGASKTRKHSNYPVPKVRDELSNASRPYREGNGEVLLSGVRQIGQPDEEKGSSCPGMQDMREDDRAVSFGNAQKQNEYGVLRRSVLVSAQPEGQSLSLGRRPARETLPGRQNVEEIRSDEGQEFLPPVRSDGEDGSPPHKAIPEPSCDPMGGIQRHNSVPPLSSKDRPAGNVDSGRVGIHRGIPVDGLAGLTFPKSAIPPGFAKWCEPASVIKPKDDISIPHAVAFALRADGWYLRSEVIWAKPNPMPESVTDRPTKAHEQVFLLSKSARYFYDADAIRDDFADDRMGNPNGGGAYSKGSGRNDSGGLATGQWTKGAEVGGRNARTIWTIATQPFSGAHFATMPPDLAKRCIKAGSAKGDTILDPFGGAGTTALVADRLQRDAIICELNPDFAAMAKDRIEGEGGMLVRVITQ